MEHGSSIASKLRALGALVLCTGFLAACSGTGNPSGTGVLPQGLPSGDRAPSVFVTPTPAPTPALAILAGVDLNLSALPLPVFALTSPAACFGGSSGGGGDDEDHGHQDGRGHHRDRDMQDRWRGDHGHHGSDGDDGEDGGSGGVSFGTPYTPASNVTVSFGAFSLTDPCTLAGGTSGSGDQSGSRHADNIVPVPPPGGAFIVATDSTAPGTLMSVDGPATLVGSTYAFAQLRFSGFTFRAGHTYAFALAAPATPSPAPSPTPTPHGHGDHD